MFFCSTPGIRKSEVRSGPVLHRGQRRVPVPGRGAGRSCAPAAIRVRRHPGLPMRTPCAPSLQAQSPGSGPRVRAWQGRPDGRSACTRGPTARRAPEDRERVPQVGQLAPEPTCGPGSRAASNGADEAGGSGGPSLSVRGFAHESFALRCLKSAVLKLFILIPGPVVPYKVYA